MELPNVNQKLRILSVSSSNSLEMLIINIRSLILALMPISTCELSFWFSLTIQILVLNCGQKWCLKILGPLDLIWVTFHLLNFHFFLRLNAIRLPPRETVFEKRVVALQVNTVAAASIAAAAIVTESESVHIERIVGRNADGGFDTGRWGENCGWHGWENGGIEIREEETCVSISREANIRPIVIQLLEREACGGAFMGGNKSV